MTRQRAFDVVLYGASGFVGRQTVAYFAQRSGTRLRWALAGRSARKLETVRAAAGAGAADAGVIVADAGDEPALAALAAQAKVVLSTAGPFSLYGSALVAACVEHGTHYCDITGETPWVRTLIDRHHNHAARARTRIVPCCGFDSVPSDIGALLVASALQREHGTRCVRIQAAHALRGGVNGGTLASLLHMADSGAIAQFLQPFLLNPEATAPDAAAAHADPVGPRHDADLDTWLAPFVMAPVNTRVVRRSAALAAAAEGDEAPYGADLLYQEGLRTGRGAPGLALATALSLGIGAGATGLRVGGLRAAVRALVPGPGQGPSEQAMDKGAFRCELVGIGADGTRVRGRVAGRGDPGNRATTVFVCEAALALAGDARRLPGGAARGGVLTPATALGLRYAQRLAAAGITVEPIPAA